MAEPPDHGRSTAVADDPAQVALLFDLDQLPYLGPFLGRESSAAAAAAELGVPVDRVLTRVRRFLRVGLLEVTRVEPRKGRAVKHYRTVADEFFVPADAVDTSADLLRYERTWQRRWTAALEAAIVDELRARTPGGGVRIHRTATGRVTADPGSAPGVPWVPRAGATPPLVFEWRPVRLAEGDARALETELRDLVARYAAAETPGAPAYALGAHLAPLPEGG